LKNIKEKNKIYLSIITLSTRCYFLKEKDESGDIIEKHLKRKFKENIVISRYLLPDNKLKLKSLLKKLCDKEKVDIIITTGGTGFSPTDITPEVTKKVIKKEAPELMMALMYEGLKETKFACLSRGIAGIRKNTLIINLPGGPSAVKTYIKFLIPIIPHAVFLLRGGVSDFKNHSKNIIK